MIPALAPEQEPNRVEHVYRDLIPFPDHGQDIPVMRPHKRGKARILNIADFREGGMFHRYREFLVLAERKCTECLGTGLKYRFGHNARLCSCVYRKATRILVNVYHANEIAAYSVRGSQLTESAKGRDSRMNWGRPAEEFNADLWMLAKRTLSPRHLICFKIHSLESNHWREIQRQTGMNRGTIWHCVYEAEAKLGQAAMELEPYPLFPLAKYFTSPTRSLMNLPFSSRKQAA
jgi:hypothetical protein